MEVGGAEENEGEAAFAPEGLGVAGVGLGVKGPEAHWIFLERLRGSQVAFKVEKTFLPILLKQHRSRVPWWPSS